MPGIGLGGGGGGRANYAALAARYYARGLIADFNATSLSALNDGDPVSTWADALGTYTATQTGTNRPTYSATGWSDGGPCISLVQASKQCMNCDALASIASVGGAYTIVAIVRLASAVDSILFGVSLGTTTPYRYVGLDSTNGNSATIVSNTSTPATLVQSNQGTYTASKSQTFTTEDALVVISCNGSSSAAWVNGQKVSGTLTGGTDVTTTYTKAVLGGMIYNSAIHPSTFSGKIRRLMVYNRGFSDRDHAALVYQLGLQSMMRWTMVGIGDSIMAGSVAGPPWLSVLTMPTLAVRLALPSGGITTQSYVANQGVAARSLVYNALATTNNEDYHILADAQFTYMPTVPQLITIHMGTNDVYYGGGTLTGAQAFASFASIVAKARAASPHSYIVGGTIINRGNWSTGVNYSGSDAAYNTAVSDCNALMRGSYASIDLDAVWDANACSALQTPGVTAATGPNFVDACHPTTAGQAALAATYPLSTYQLAAVNKLLQLQLVS